MTSVRTPADAGPPGADAVTAQAWYDLILQRCGLTFRHVSVPDVIGTVRTQMLARGIASERVYYERLAGASADAAEWDGLIERLTNHETSFFRHPPSFEAVHKHLLPDLREQRRPGRRLSLWSAGCSTGQEAYSLAMVAMADSALQGEFIVWGGDISHEAIKAARNGRYGLRAIATVPEDYRQRFLRQRAPEAGGEYEVVDQIRERVRFMVMNLVAPAGFSPRHDLIFCHNVLIYFSPAAVTRVVARLASCLSLGGYLVLGPGEAPNDRPSGLEPVALNGVRAFQRRRARLNEVAS
jgi:chemotaxis methyl-accepting protein methylase